MTNEKRTPGAERLTETERKRDLVTVAEAVSFFAACVKCGEAWSATCEQQIGEAREALARLTLDAPGSSVRGRGASDMEVRIARFAVKTAASHCAEAIDALNRALQNRQRAAASDEEAK